MSKDSRNVYHTREKLVELLESRGMIVEDHTIFERINYSHLIYNFGKHYLIDPNRKQYRPGTKLSHLYHFYKFNMNFSFKLMKALSYFEHELRANTAAYLSVRGSLGYLEIETYSPFYTHNSQNMSDYKLNRAYSEIDRFVNGLRMIEQNKRSKYDSKYYVNGKLPIWLLVDELPFGQLRMFLKYTQIEKEVLKAMNIDETKWWIIVVANQYRNQISHINPLVPSIENPHGPVYHLKNLLYLIKEKYPDVFADILISFNQYDFSKINIPKDYIAKYLDIQDVIHTFFTSSMHVTAE